VIDPGLSAPSCRFAGTVARAATGSRESVGGPRVTSEFGCRGLSVQLRALDRTARAARVPGSAQSASQGRYAELSRSLCSRRAPARVRVSDEAGIAIPPSGGAKIPQRELLPGRPSHDGQGLLAGPFPSWRGSAPGDALSHRKPARAGCARTSRWREFHCEQIRRLVVVTACATVGVDLVVREPMRIRSSAPGQVGNGSSGSPR
jgi:hypothetical protein